MIIIMGAYIKMVLYDYIKVKRRYTRSINLERDLEVSESVNGYILTPKIENLINHFIDSITASNAVRSWTITGPYGTGKSAFAHFLSAICSSQEEGIRNNAYNILKNSDINLEKLSAAIPKQGFIKVVVTAQKESIANTLVRGLKYGSDRYYSNARGLKGKLRTDLDVLYKKALNGEIIPNDSVISLMVDFAKYSKSGIIIIIDELGKNLEYCSQNQLTADLYLLQQIAELPSGNNNPIIFFLGLLHQAFYDYSNSLATAQRNEWMKIQGRFEDFPFIESPTRLVHIMANAIDQSGLDDFNKSRVNKWSKSWQNELSALKMENIQISDIGRIYPFNPLCAITLPVLCNKFSQNDRTLFTYLASDIPNSFKTFLKNTVVDSKLPTVKIHNLYDFFVESMSVMSTSFSNSQRLYEIQNSVSENANLDKDSLNALKTIGVLNLISNMGFLKASFDTTVLSLCDEPGSDKERDYWLKIIEGLISKGIVRHINIIDGLRIWEGTDFDIEKELTEELQKITLPLPLILNEYYPLNPLIVRRHSFTTGTIRYLEQYYVDAIPKNIKCERIDSDGVILYATKDYNSKELIESFTEEGKPIIVIFAKDVKLLKNAIYEYAALKNINKNKKELLTDGVARKEVNNRLHIAKEVLRSYISKSFDITKSKCFIEGNFETFSNIASFNGRLSDIFDSIYSKGLVLWNELINKRKLTSQGSRAIRKLLEAMLNNSDKARLGLKGYGPESAIYDSVLLNTGIHCLNDENWDFGVPRQQSGIYFVWEAIDNFFKESIDTPRSLDMLYDLLQKPPYGIKQGIIPILIFAVLLQQSDYLSIYINGSYIPVMGNEHLELLTKRPTLFSVKYLKISGLKIKLFKELGDIVSDSNILKNKAVRNATLLSIVNPLIKFANKLPKYTKETNNLSEEAKAIREALINAKDPEELLFRALPQACGYSFVDANSESVVKNFRKKLVLGLQELQNSYDNLLSKNRNILANAFSFYKDKDKNKDLDGLREYIRAIVGRVYTHTNIVELSLKRFMQATINKDLDDKAWLESIIMVISDKPMDSWSDNDAISFEINLGVLIKRFKSIEAIIDFIPNKEVGFEAKKITITHQDGNEFTEVLWLDIDEKNKMEITGQRIKSEYFKDNDKINKALLSTLIEMVLTKDNSQADKEEKQVKSKNELNSSLLV